MPNSMQQDYAGRVYQPSDSTQVRRLRANHRRRRKRQAVSFSPKKLIPVFGTGMLLFVVVVLLLGSGKRVDASVAMPQEEWLTAELPKQGSLFDERREILRSGDTAVSALHRLGFPFAEISGMIAAAKPVYPLKNVQAGKAFVRRDTADGLHVVYEIDAGRFLHLQTKVGEGWRAAVEQRAISTRRVLAQGEIRDSLFIDAARAGMDERTTMNLVDIFSWDIDFARDLRVGDRFQVLFEEQFDDTGKQVGSTILAAEFINQKQVFQAVRFVQPDGRAEYFTPQGKSLRKSYLKAPVKFSRISSRFRLHRKHPILGYTRAHRGVDYAAPAGTAVRAVGDGRISFKGWKGGYGRMIVIRHTNGNHSTAYAHLRAFARGMRPGRKVRQGQVIGYVGMSGLATGPHLHFEFRVRGRAVNPLTVKRSPARPIDKSDMAAFRHQTQPLLDRLQDTTPLLAWG
ncbi:MAG: peptidoglycan DD-metalloendopeptidase family protein [Mariprofundaceae bacterium]|nr:peptidoglycan DD-metalloendopeptidase family protein [Mariprofundaceae bacterium]